jgi:hypothetical protein
MVSGHQQAKVFRTLPVSTNNPPGILDRVEPYIESAW